jgi:DUF177 domain-containing protein
MERPDPGANLGSMAHVTDIFDIGRLGLSSGEGRRLELEVAIEPFEFGGQEYAVEAGRVPATLDVAHTTTGYSLRLRYDADLEGPCMRCLEEAHKAIAVDAREIDQPGGGEELDSPYLEEERLDLTGWTRDALALALPSQIVCRADCLGLCPVCGENLNRAGPEHRHEREPDPRWAALRELNLE